jgi:hypothetical protein
MPCSNNTCWTGEPISSTSFCTVNDTGDLACDSAPIYLTGTGTTTSSGTIYYSPSPIPEPTPMHDLFLSLGFIVFGVACFAVLGTLVTVWLFKAEQEGVNASMRERISELEVKMYEMKSTAQKRGRSNSR